MGHRIQFDRYPGGVMKALTLSYDDGVVHDRRLVEICNRYGLRGTFNLNSGTLGNPGRIEAGEVAELYAGHEVAVHTVTHPTLPYVPNELLTEEIIEDRKALEKLVGYPVRGMAYPNGGYDRALSTKLAWLGIDYARTVESHSKYTLPDRRLNGIRPVIITMIWRGMLNVLSNIPKQVHHYYSTSGATVMSSMITTTGRSSNSLVRRLVAGTTSGTPRTSK